MITQADMVKALIAEAITKGIPLAELVKGVGAEAKAQRDAEQAAIKAKQEKLASISTQLLELFNEIVEEHADELEVANGVWYVWDFDSGAKSMRLLKAQASTGTPRAPSASNGGGRVFEVTTDDLVKKYAEYTFTSEDVAKWDDQSWEGKTIVEVAAMTKGNKNANFKLRNFLLKKDGQK